VEIAALRMVSASAKILMMLRHSVMQSARLAMAAAAQHAVCRHDQSDDRYSDGYARKFCIRCLSHFFLLFV
jgi:hypothetical protein